MEAHWTTPLTVTGLGAGTIENAIDGAVSDGQFSIIDKRWIVITLPDHILIPRIKLFTKGVCFGHIKVK